VEVKIKKLHPNAQIPKYSREGDAGLDLTAVTINYIEDQDGRLDILEIGTGLAVEIPFGYVGLIYPRSSIFKFDLMLVNSVGVIDSNYRGELILKYKISDRQKREWLLFGEGDRVAQIVIIPYPQINFVETKDLSDSNRGAHGFGSSGV